MIPVPLAAAAILIVLGIAGLFLSAAMEKEEKGRLAARVARAMGGLAVASPAAAPTTNKARAKGSSAGLRLLFTYRIRHSWAVDTSTTTLLVIGLGCAAASGFLCLSLLRLPPELAAAVAIALFLAVPRFLILRRQRRAEARFVEAFPDTVDMIVRMLRAGLPVASAIAVVGKEAPAPISTAFRTIAEETQIGIPFEEALAASGERIGLADYRFFVVALGLQRSTGGNLASTLEMLSEIIRKRRAIRLKAKAATAEVRISAVVLGGIPFFILAALIFLSPHYLAPFVTDPRGHILAGSAFVSLAAGGISMRWMMRRALLD